jgi:hypothetical protein
MDPSTLEDILILKFNTNLWSAQFVQTILQEDNKDQNSLCTPRSASTLTTATGGSSNSSSAVNIFEDMDEDNVDEKEGSDFDD